MELCIAAASGKGGTGKTLISTNLASCLETEIQLLDCDVEEPNCHFFIQWKDPQEKTVNVLLPQIDMKECIHCGKCSQICQYNYLNPVSPSQKGYQRLMSR